MPKQYQTQIAPRRASSEPLSQRTAQTQVSATPVAAPVAPAEDSFEGSLLRGLQSLNPALSAWNEQAAGLARQEAAERLAAERAEEQVRGGAAEVRGEPLPPETTREFRAGFMVSAGSRGGAQDRESLHQMIAQNRDNPEWDFDRETSKFIAERVKGIEDPYYVQAYHRQLQDEVVQQKRKLDDYRLAQQRKDTVDAHEHALFNVASLSGTAQDRHAAYVMQSRAGRAQGLTWDASADGFTRAMITRAKGALDESFLDELYIHSPATNGVAPGADPKRNASIEEARIAIRTKLQQNVRQGVDVNTAIQKSEVDRMIDQDPMAFGQDEGSFLRAMARFTLSPNERPGSPGKWINTTDELAGYISKWRESRDKMVTKLQAERRWEQEPQSMLGTPEGEDRARASFGQIWGQVNWGDSQSVLQAFVHSVREVQRTGHADPSLKGLLSVSTMALTHDGKVPEQFSRAAMLYQTLRERGDEGELAKLLSDDNRAVLERYVDATTQDRMDPVQAFKEAKKALDPDERRRINSVLTTQAQQGIAEEFKKLTSRGLFRPLTPTGEESSDHLQQFQDSIRRKIDRGMSLERATKASKEEFSQRLVWDGHSNYFLLPQDDRVLAQREALGSAVKRELDDLVSINPNTTFKVVTSADGARFYATDAQTGRMHSIGTREELIEKYKVKTLSTDEQRAQAQNLLADLRQGKLSEQQIAEAMPRLRDMRSRGHISGRADQQLFADAETKAAMFNRRSAMAAAAAVSAMTASLGTPPAPPTPEQLSAIQSVPVLEPTSGAPRTKDLVNTYGTRDPLMALIAAAEGYMDKVYTDIGGNRTIGLGYNISSRDKETVRKDLARAGVAPHLVDQVIAGEAKMTSDQVVNLTKQIVAKDYGPKAKAELENLMGKGAWDLLNPGQQAVVTYLSYNTGSAGQFKSVLQNLTQGNTKAAAESLQLWAKDNSRNGQMRRLERAEGLLRAMMHGPENFLVYFNGGAKPSR